MVIYLSILGAFGVTGETLRALWQERNDHPEHEWIMSPQYLQACIDRTRGQILAHFLDNTKADVFLNLDDDVVLEPGGITYIAEQAIALNALVGPIIQKRTLNQGYACRMPAGTNVLVGDPHPILLGPIDWVGGTCYAMPRHIVETLDEIRTLDNWIPAHLPFLRRVSLVDGAFVLDENGEYYEYVSEDAALTSRVQQFGFNAYLLPKISGEHIGKAKYLPQHALPQLNDGKVRFYQPRYSEGTYTSKIPKALQHGQKAQEEAVLTKEQ